MHVKAHRGEQVVEGKEDCGVEVVGGLGPYGRSLRRQGRKERFAITSPPERLRMSLTGHNPEELTIPGSVRGVHAEQVLKSSPRPRLLEFEEEGPGVIGAVPPGDEDATSGSSDNGALRAVPLSALSMALFPLGMAWNHLVSHVRLSAILAVGGDSAERSMPSWSWRRESMIQQPVPALLGAAPACPR